MFMVTKIKSLLQNGPLVTLRISTGCNVSSPLGALQVILSLLKKSNFIHKNRAVKA